jgi:hypothetical protein
MKFYAETKEELIDILEGNKGDLPPKNAENGDLFMNHEEKVFVFLNNEWNIVEDFVVEKNFQNETDINTKNNFLNFIENN